MLAPGTVVWVHFSKTSTWPSRIARHSEVSPELRAKQKNKDYLVYYFGAHNYQLLGMLLVTQRSIQKAYLPCSSSSWVKASQIEEWDGSDEVVQKYRKKTSAKSFDVGIEEANEWKDSESRLFPVFEYPKSKQREAFAEASKPTKKRVRQEEVEEEEEEVATPSKKKKTNTTSKKRTAAMRKLGLFPPSESPYTIRSK